MADNVILVLNAGSSSIKFSAFTVKTQGLTQVMRGQIESLATNPRFLVGHGDKPVQALEDWAAPGTLTHDEAVAQLVAFLQQYRDQFHLVGVGHRVVHGGARHAGPALVDDALLEELAALTPLAPLHQPHNLAPMRALRSRLPDLPQVACFDTAFHRDQPELAQRFALPEAITRRGVRRYGFHGLSYEFIAQALAERDPASATGRVIVAHLGNGASLCAIHNGKSVAGTTGFTAVDGLPMGTRTGVLDPGVILYLLDDLHMNARQIENLLYKESGLLGVSGISSDMRVLLESDAPQARLAVDLFVYRIGREIGSLAAALGGLDALVFTAGIGEHAAFIRAAVCQQAAWLGVRLDEPANATGKARINAQESRVAVWVIPTNEEAMIARHTAHITGLN
ncbi:acetate/propionate family kinase [Silvimonas amylolytica]|uniref:Acetate kinase n=1 Tax=Silvimonas amylolytica TaxID=449663 RepID=A0ABQ2PHT9_9NEIS|nr:acetate/propionate family kinase [Silvimonas amylolytica]GGP24873.1 acetate kinase [Silvimonas amylolytica]